MSLEIKNRVLTRLDNIHQRSLDRNGRDKDLEHTSFKKKRKRAFKSAYDADGNFTEYRIGISSRVRYE